MLLWHCLTFRSLYVCPVTQSCPILCNPMDGIAFQALLFMGFSRQEYWSGFPCPTPEDLPDLGLEPRSPALQADYLPPEPPGKPKNTRGGSLSRLQEIFLIQKSNWGLMQCRQILYQLSYEGSLVTRNLIPFSTSLFVNCPTTLC